MTGRKRSGQVGRSIGFVDRGKRLLRAPSPIKATPSNKLKQRFFALKQKTRIAFGRFGFRRILLNVFTALARCSPFGTPEQVGNLKPAFDVPRLLPTLKNVKRLFIFYLGLKWMASYRPKISPFSNCNLSGEFFVQ
jgi:hypothetical protein